MTQKRFIITKADGRKVSFNENKILSTCMRAGATRKTAKKILKKVRSNIFRGMATSNIYDLVLNAMKEEKLDALYQRYQLKDAIMRLGPSGFHFENYVANLIQQYGMKLKGMGKKVKGKCAKHEIDLIAESKNKKYLIECKYHSSHGVYTGLKVSLYTHARFLDTFPQFNGEVVICNTKISSSAKKYAKCIGQQVYSWRYPSNRSLEKIIEKNKLYPITILDLSENELQAFARNKIMIAKTILKINAPELSKQTDIPIKRIINLQKMIGQILNL